MDSESAERLIEIMLQMKINFVHITETLHQQTIEIRQQLGMVFENEKKGLDDCMAAIDRKLKECSMCVESYRTMYAHLATMREKLVQLGGHPTPMPAALPTDQLDAVVTWRLQELKFNGKI
jgi:hypothetical protein